MQYFIITGKPCKVKNSPDYVPTIFNSAKNDQQDTSKDNSQSTQLPIQAASLRRYERLQRRRLQQSARNNVLESHKPADVESFEQPDLEAAGTSTQSMADNGMVEPEDVVQEAIAPEVELEDVSEVANLDFTDPTAEIVPNPDEDISSIPGCSTTLSDIDCHQHTSSKKFVDKEVSTEDNFESREELLEKLRHQQWLFSLVKAELDTKMISTSPSRMLENDDKRTHYFTGLPSYSVFTTLLELLSKATKPYAHFGLSPADQLLMVLTKLRHADPHQHLAYQFGIDITRVSKIFHHWINVMHAELQPLIKWPQRDMLRKTLPACFKPQYSRATCIIDCSEIFIQRPTSLTARSQTYSNYKSRNTVKFLIAISPTGAIIFVSKCWGGRASDKHITSHSGFLNKLIHGDLVLADRGFDITEALACYGANLAIPPFTKGKPQLSCREVETARELSRVRIHVERAIGRVKNYKLLQATLPITLVKNPRDQGYCVIDKILFVCCALCNLQPPLVS